MEEYEVSTTQEIQIAPQPVVFMPQPAGKVALATLSVVAAGLAVSVPKVAMATQTQSTPQPVIFMSQPTSLEIVTGEKLLQYETHLSERLGMKPISNCSSGTTSSNAASDCDD